MANTEAVPVLIPLHKTSVLLIDNVGPVFTVSVAP